MKYLDITAEVLLNSLVLSLVAAMIRILFSKLDKFGDAIRIYIGSILFGVTAGYVLNDFSAIKPWLKIIIIIFSMFGKELFLWLELLLKDPTKNIGIIIKLISALKSIKIGINKDKEND